VRPPPLLRVRELAVSERSQVACGAPLGKKKVRLLLASEVHVPLESSPFGRTSVKAPEGRSSRLAPVAAENQQPTIGAAGVASGAAPASSAPPVSSGYPPHPPSTITTVATKPQVRIVSLVVGIVALL